VNNNSKANSLFFYRLAEAETLILGGGTRGGRRRECRYENNNLKDAEEGGRTQESLAFVPGFVPNIEARPCCTVI
jgi:hypothetical protein